MIKGKIRIDQINDPISLSKLFLLRMGVPKEILVKKLFIDYKSYTDFVFDVFRNSNKFKGITGHFKRMFIRKKKGEDVFLLGYFDPYSFQWDMIEWDEDIYKDYFYFEEVEYKDFGNKLVTRFHSYIPSRKGKLSPLERRPLHNLVQIGDLVYIGNHIIRCGSCIDYIKDVNEDIKLIYTDPPYGVNVADVHDKGSSFDDLSKGELFDLLYNFGFEVKKRFADRGINIPIFMWKGIKLEGDISTFAFLSGLHGKRFIDYIDGMRLFGDNYLTQLIWVKTSSASSLSKSFWSSIEPIDVMMTIGDYEGEKINFDNYIIYFKPSRSYGHVSIKPVFINSFYIKASTKPNDWILDAFGGSGSTLMSAEITGRRAYLIELSPEFVEYTIARWQAYRRWAGLSTEVFIERNGKKYKVNMRFDKFRLGDNRIDIERGMVFRSKKEMLDSYNSKYGKLL